MYKRGEIVLIPVPYSDLSSAKRRPVLVVSTTAHNSATRDMIVVAITSNLQQNGIVIETHDLLSGNLPKTSLIRCDKIYTLEQSIVIKRFGAVSASVLSKVVGEINSLIDERVNDS